MAGSQARFQMCRRSLASVVNTTLIGTPGVKRSSDQPKLTYNGLTDDGRGTGGAEPLVSWLESGGKAMKSSSLLIACLSISAALILFGSPAQASGESNKQPTDAKTPPSPTSTSADRTLVYKPPLRGAPATRVGGGTRSGETTSITLSVLAPDHTGYTVQGKPTIYWYVSKPITSPVELTVTAQEAIEPLLELTLPPPIKEGIHALRLTDHGVSLKPEVEYQWFVAVVKNPDERSKDVLAGGSIKRVPPSEAVRTKLSELGEIMWPAVYAESGLWYDAVDEISKLIQANPADGGLREQRASLLTQAGLSQAAAYDRNTLK